jgi:hypothetical protein
MGSQQEKPYQALHREVIIVQVVTMRKNYSIALCPDFIFKQCG